MNFLRKPRPTSDLQTALDSLEATSRARPELAVSSRTLAQVLQAVFHPKHLDRNPHVIRTEEYEDAWRQGLPVLRAFPPRLNPDGTRGRLLELSSILRKYSHDAAQFHNAVRRNSIDLRSWSVGWIKGDREPIWNDAEGLGIGREFVGTALRFALLPSLALMTVDARAPTDWLVADCPYCGVSALLAELRGLEQGRYLRCGLCAGSWSTARLGCPHCGTTDHASLRWLGVEGETDRKRVQCCDACGNRLKLIATLAPLSASGLVAAELELVHLDFL